MLNNISRLCSKWLNPTLLPAGPLLSQIGTLIVHRLTNQLDQEIVKKAVGAIDQTALLKNVGSSNKERSI
jgi:hypothetical protein